jgi:preprotein translocase subunit SecF
MKKSKNIKNNKVATIVIVVIWAISILVFMGAYRQNNIRMIELREAVFIADKENGDVDSALRDLRQHVYGHMNTDLTGGSEIAIRPPIQLKYRYEQLVAQEKSRVEAKNESVYAEAERTCEARYPAGRLADGRVQCVQDYVSINGVVEQSIPKELYQFDFVSPRWSPDLAGWSFILMIISLALIIFRLGRKLLVRE